MLTRSVQAAVVAALFLAHPFAEAASYTFINVADTATLAPEGTFALFVREPTITNGSAGFFAYYDAGNGAGAFAGSGGAISTIAVVGGPAPIGTYAAVGVPAVSGGIAALYASYDGGTAVVNVAGVPTKIAKQNEAAPAGVFLDFHESIAISADTTAFHGTFNAGASSGIFNAMGGSPVAIVQTGDTAPVGTFTDFGPPAISGTTTAYRGSFGVSDSGIFATTAGMQTMIARTGDAAPVGTFTSFGDPTQSGGTTAFAAFYNGGVEFGVFAGNGGAPLPIALMGDAAPSGTFGGFSNPAIGGSTVAFSAVYDGAAQLGIFATNGGPLAKVISTGEPLFGSTVSTLVLGRFGVDPDGSGRIAFRYSLADGRSGVAIATPPEIPEPGVAAFVLVCVAASCMVRQRQTLARVGVVTPCR